MVLGFGGSNYASKVDTLQKHSGKQQKKKVKAGKRSRIKGQYPASADRKTQEAVEKPARRTDKKTPDKSCKDVLAFPDTGEVSLFKNKNYQCSVSIGIHSSQMHLVVCVFNTGAGPNIIRVDALVTVTLADTIQPTGWIVSTNATCQTFAVHPTPR